MWSARRGCRCCSAAEPMVEPLLGIEAPLQEAQVLESRLINLLHFQTLIAKAARMVLPAPGARSGGRPARCQRRLPRGVHRDREDEAPAFFAQTRPDQMTQLLDTYDTKVAVETAAALAPRLSRDGIAVRGVRLDGGGRKGDLARPQTGVSPARRRQTPGPRHPHGRGRHAAWGAAAPTGDAGGPARPGAAHTQPSPRASAHRDGAAAGESARARAERTLPGRGSIGAARSEQGGRPRGGGRLGKSRRVGS